MAIKRIAPDIRGDGYRVGIVLSRFNPAIGDGLLAGALRALREAGVKDERVTVVTVPGALESPLALQRTRANRRLRRAGRAGRGHSRRHVSLRDRLQRVGGRRVERRARVRHSDRQRHPDLRHRRAGSSHGWTRRASRPRRRRSRSPTSSRRSTMRTSSRRRSRELVLQGLYQRQLSGNAAHARARRPRREPGLPARGPAVLRRDVGRRRPTTTTRCSPRWRRTSTASRRNCRRSSAPSS